MTQELFTFGVIDNCSKRMQYVVGCGEGHAVRASGTLRGARAYARECDWIGHISVADRVTLKIIESGMSERHAEKYKQWCCHRLFESAETPHHAAMLVAAYTGVSTKEVESSVNRGETRFTDENLYTSWPSQASENLSRAFKVLEGERQLAFEDDEMGGLKSFHKGRRW